MSGRVAPVAGCATLLEADPRLGRIVGVREAAAIGHRAILPVLAAAAGPWTPPQRSGLGPGAVRLTVLDGLLTDGATVLGPGDALEPWTQTSWTACTAVRVAVIGDAYADALREWPLADVDHGREAGARVPTAGALEDRLLELLWRIALRWGELVARGIALPPALDLLAVQHILGVPETRLALAFAGLRDRGATIRNGASLTLLTRREGETRRDALLGAVAQQLALSRATRDECLALCALVQLEIERRARG
jgi:CRP/FNR family transcriptional regulator, cyclic AMP receptor protein